MKQKFENLGLILNRDTQKKIQGGQNCSFVWQDGNGQWHTEHGQCSSTYVTYITPLGVPFEESIGYCHTANHQYPSALSSNGGVSRC